jgi:hypothetical protein
MNLELTDDEFETLTGIFIGIDYMDTDERALRDKLHAIWDEKHKDVLAKFHQTLDKIATSEDCAVTAGSMSVA